MSKNKILAVVALGVMIAVVIISLAYGFKVGEQYWLGVVRVMLTIWTYLLLRGVYNWAIKTLK